MLPGLRWQQPAPSCPLALRMRPAARSQRVRAVQRCSVGGGGAWVPPSCMTSGSAAEAEHAGGGASRQTRANSVAQECRVVLRVRGAYCGARTPELVIAFRAARGTARIVRSDDRVEVLNVLPHQAVHVAYAVVVACTAACVGHVSLASHRVHLEQLANRCRIT